MGPLPLSGVGEKSMPNMRFDRLLAGTALAAALALTATSSDASAQGRARSAAVPAPTTTAASPPAAKDFTADKPMDATAKTANAGEVTNTVSGAGSAKTASADSAVADKLR